MKQANLDIRKYAKDRKVRLWEVAEALGINETLLSRKMRHELDESEKKQLFNAIDKIVMDEAYSA